MRLETRTLVLTDLVDSTRLLAQVGDARSAALNAAVDRCTRDLLGRRGGLEIDKTDGFLLLFEEPAQALGFAVDLHDALRALSEAEGLRLAMRVGVHRGEVGLRENPPEDVARGAKPLEVEGLAKPLAARVMGLATGEQTLVTDGTPRTVDHPDAATLAWRDHGAWRLKGVPEPVRLWELGRPGLAPLAPPPDSEKAWRAASGPLAPHREALRRTLAQRAVRGLLAVALLGVVGGAAWRWDHGREKRSLHATATWTPQGMVGVGEPLPDEPHVVMVRQGGRVKAIEHVNAAGLPRYQRWTSGNEQLFGLSLLLSGGKSEPHWVQIHQWNTGRGQWAPRLVQVHDDQGRLVRLEHRTAVGLLTAQATVEPREGGLRLRWQTPYGAVGSSPDDAVFVEDLDFDDRGRPVGRRFYDPSGINPMESASGVSGERFVVDDLGRATVRTSLDAQGQPVADGSGAAIVERRYHGDGWVEAEVRSLGPDGAPVDPAQGCARLVQSEDGAESWCYGADGAPASHPDGVLSELSCHHRVVAHDADGSRRTRCEDEQGVHRLTRVEHYSPAGRPARIDLLGPDGAPARGDQGWSTAVHFYGEDGLATATPQFLGVDGQPMLRRSRTDGDGRGAEHRRGFRYDASGALVEIAHIDIEGRGVNRDGMGLVRLERDAGGRAVAATLHRADGSPLVGPSGVHRQVNTLDTQGRPTEVRRYGLGDEPAVDPFGAHRDALQWDEQGRLVDIAWFGVDGQPVERPKMYLKSTESHRIAIRYTPQGRVERLDFYDADGGRGGNYKGRAAQTFEWDERGELVGQAYWDGDDQPVVSPETGYHRIHSRTVTARAAGPVFETDLLQWGEGGERIAVDGGCYTWAGTLDALGALVEERCLALDGQPAVSADGIARIRYLYDPEGRFVGQQFHDDQGQLAPGADGVATVEIEWTDQGWLRSWTQRDAQGQLVDGGPGAPAVLRFDYDERGRVAGYVRQDSLGEPLGLGRVVVDWSVEGFPIRAAWPDWDGGRQLVLTRGATDDVEALAWQNSDGGVVDGPEGWAEAQVRRTDGTTEIRFTRADGTPAHLGGYPAWSGGTPLQGWTMGQDGPVIASATPYGRDQWRDYGTPGFSHFAELEGLPGWSGYRMQHDTDGELVGRTFLDGDGQPVVPTDPGFASASFESTPQGIHRRFFDAAGEPMEVCGVAEVVPGPDGTATLDLAGQPATVPEACRDRNLVVRQRSPAAEG